MTNPSIEDFYNELVEEDEPVRLELTTEQVEPTPPPSEVQN